MIIFALTGVKGSGKTTASLMLKDLNPAFEEITLAKRLKDASASVFGVDRNSFDDPAVKEKELETPVYLDASNVKKIFDFYQITPDYDKHVRPHIGTVLHSPRRIAQYIGTEVLRNYNDDIHCMGATLGLKEDGIYVVTDMRFVSEYQYFEKKYTQSFYPYHVQNALAERKVDNHPSEMQVFEVAKFCTKLPNNGTLEDLRKKVTEIYSDVTGSKFKEQAWTR